MDLINLIKYKSALDLAHKLHLKQKRKGTAIPYLTHLMSVSALVMENGGNTDEAIAGLLHDAVEDQGGEKTLHLIRSKFGSTVASIVKQNSDADVIPKPPWIDRKKKYVAAIKTKTQSALLVSCCDKLHNATCIIEDHRAIGKKVWRRFNATPKQIGWYYQELSKAFSKYLKGHKALTKRYDDIVKELIKRTKR